MITKGNVQPWDVFCIFEYRENKQSFRFLGTDNKALPFRDDAVRPLHRDNILYSRLVCLLLVWMELHIHYRNQHRLPCAFLCLFDRLTFYHSCKPSGSTGIKRWHFFILTCSKDINKMTCIKCGHSKQQKQYKTTGKFHDITIDCNCPCHKIKHSF